MKKFNKLTLFFFFLGLINYSQVREPRINIEDFTGTEELANEKIQTLEALISEAETLGLNADKEKMTISTSKVFLIYANWDENNKSFNEGHFDGLHTFHQTTAANLADHLATYERSEVITMLDEAIENINSLISGDVVRKPTPIINWANISYNGNQLIHDGKPVFLADYTWQEEKAGAVSLEEYFGAYDGYFVNTGMVTNDAGDITPWVLNELNSKPEGNFGTMFIGHANVPSWLETKYPNIRTGGSLFTKYDIDNPGTKEAVGALLDGVIPLMNGKNYTGQGYLLANEPHWNLTGNWEVITFSDYTKDKFKVWLQNKHTDISNLNTLWGTSYSNFDDVVIPSFPMSINQIGTPRWYDIVRFNQERVTDWFTWMNDKVISHDPTAKTHIKLIPSMWAEGTHTHGLDFEALTDLTVNIGNDAGAKNSYRWGGSFAWENRYAFEWKAVSMPYDFFRSVAPNKVNYNSEGHYIQDVAFSDLFLDTNYVRAVNWLSVLQGMNSIKTWFWSRTASGSINDRNQDIAGSVIQQPRVVNEITSTFMDLNAHSEHISALQHLKQPIRVFYSETSAINKANYMDDVFKLYESVYFEGSSIGFASKNIIQKQNNTDWDVILINNTEFVTVEEINELQTYLDKGGTVILDAVSLKKDEYGNAHSISLSSGSGQIISASGIENIKTQALSVISSKGKLPFVTLTETNNLNLKGCLWKSYKDNDGKHILNTINLGKGIANITLGLRNETGTIETVDLLTGKVFGDTFEMLPNTILLLEVREKNIGDDTLSIEIKGETCPDKGNGQVKIIASTSDDFSAVFNNGSPIVFTGETTIESVVPGTYDLCVTNITNNLERCYSLVIPEGATVSGKSSLNKDQVAVNIEQGSAPYSISVNGKEIFETSSSSFLVSANYGDFIEVKTNKDCEGVFSTMAGGNLVSHPNPTDGFSDIIMPANIDQVELRIYDVYSQLISSKTYHVTNGKIQIDLNNKTAGMYIAIVQLDTPIAVKIIKK